MQPARRAKAWRRLGTGNPDVPRHPRARPLDQGPIARRWDARDYVQSNAARHCDGAYFAFSTSGSTHVFSNSALVGAYARNINSNLRAGSVGSQFASFPAGAFGPM